jgi:hypothetical protein
MQFLMIICHDDAFAPTKALVSQINAWITEMEGNRIRVHGNPLRPPSDATTVRVRKGKLVRNPGPFTDSNEKMCAYELIDCENLEQAVDVASKHPMAKAATIEVRPVWAELAAPSTIPTS